MKNKRREHRITLRDGLWEEAEQKAGARKMSEYIEALIDADLQPGRTKRQLAEIEERLRKVEGE